VRRGGQKRIWNHAALLVLVLVLVLKFANQARHARAPTSSMDSLLKREGRVLPPKNLDCATKRIPPLFHTTIPL